mmetsp:Transcript_15249/g.32583  ORF Transcript_15249/g.32583 Transcript_15249/m.32583 type:complete len:307 (-) Transcript_15249:73-993(-)
MKRRFKPRCIRSPNSLEDGLHVSKAREDQRCINNQSTARPCKRRLTSYLNQSVTLRVPCKAYPRRLFCKNYSCLSFFAAFFLILANASMRSLATFLAERLASSSLASFAFLPLRFAEGNLSPFPRRASPAGHSTATVLVLSERSLLFAFSPSSLKAVFKTALLSPATAASPFTLLCPALSKAFFAFCRFFSTMGFFAARSPVSVAAAACASRFERSFFVLRCFGPEAIRSSRRASHFFRFARLLSFVSSHFAYGRLMNRMGTRSPSCRSSSSSSSLSETPKPTGSTLRYLKRVGTSPPIRSSKSSA